MKPIMKWIAQSLLMLAMITTAKAGEIIFYEFSDFNGNSLTVRSTATNFANLGFNDRTSSVIVRSGTWQVCTNADFKGTCVTVERGEYSSLDYQLDNKISSAREIGGRSDSNYGNRRRGAIELFEYPGFFGRSKKYERDISNLQPEGFNDRTRAIVITEGTWELCADANFRNYCQSFGPGRYADIDSELSGKVSSLRLIAGYDNAPYSHSGGRDYSPQRSGGRIIFYNEEGFTGRNFDLSEEAANFANARFNDETVSVLVESGTWEVCTDSFFRGQCRTLSPGTVRRLEAPFYRSISSARLVQDNANAGRDDDRRRGIEIFEHSDFNGRKFSARRSVNDLSEEDFNDIASSIIIYSGQWEVCVDAYFRGRCVVYGPGRYANLYGLNDQISSLRRLDRP